MSQPPQPDPFEPYQPGAGTGENAAGGPPPPPTAPAQQSSYGYGQPYAQPYAQPYVQGYGQYGYGAAVPDHPQATTVLVLGIASVFVGVVGPVAWIMGSRVKKEIEASNGRLGGLQNVTIGWILGIIMSVLLILGLLAFVVLFAVVLGGFAVAG